MRAAPFVVVMVTAAISVAAQQPGSAPPAGKTVTVQIFVGSHASNEARCLKEKLDPTTVLVDNDPKGSKDVHHCVDRQLLDHDDENNPKLSALFERTLVRLNRRDYIRWEANEPFRVAQVRRHPPAAGVKPNPLAPHYPFVEPLPTAFAREVTVGAVLDLSDEVTQRYKVAFQFEKTGLVDPDFVCSM